MRFDVLSLFPDTIEQACNFSIIKRALNEHLIEINAVNPRDYTIDKHKKVDDTPYGGGAGMLLSCQPYLDALKSVPKSGNVKTIIMSPQGQCFNQEMAKQFALYDQLIIICGHYEGIDQRFIDECVDEEISLGDFVLTGGEIAAMAVTDAVCRMVPGVLADPECFEDESHYNGLLEYPQYSRPAVWHGREVPPILLSGDHKKVALWRRKQALRRTRDRRPDMYEKLDLSSKRDKKLLMEIETEDLAEQEKI